jgi:hypothetical protein
MTRRIALLALALTAPLPALAQTSVGVSIGINQPGVYGRVDIGNLPPPPVILPRPVLIAPPAIAVQAPPPMYLYVPPGHQKHWAKHCAEYGACGHPVYFVQEKWVRERYEREHGRDEGKGHDKGHGKGKGHGNKHDD